MKKSVFIVIFILLCLSVFAAGKKEVEEEKEPINNDWILCISALDNSSLSESQRPVVDLFMLSLTDRIQTVKYRLRVSPEYAYYEEYAWSRELASAAKTLETRQNERALLLYQGEPEWRYRQNIKKRNEEVAKAREEYEKKAAERPVVNQMPNFDISPANKEGSFPPAPLIGAEYQFCQNQRVDGFISGTIIEFYGRYYVTLKLYVQYTRSFIFEDSIIFSTDDIDEAVDNIAKKLTMILAGNKPAAIAINADPPETLILINQSFAGRGSVPVTELPPGEVTVAFSTDEYNGEMVEIELLPDELAEITVSLSPHVKGEVEIRVPARTGAMVYQGALYMGEAPFSLWLPLNQLDYVNVLTPLGEESRAVYFSPENINEGLSLSLSTKFFPPAGSRRVDKARRRHYWAWGGTWIAGITAWISSGISTGYISASSNGDPALVAKANQMYYISMGALAVTGVVAVYDFIQMFRYINTATENTTRIVKTEKGN